MPTQKNKTNPKIAIVHDFLTYFGGAEQVLLSLHSLYPKAPIYTLLYDKEKMEKYFPNTKIRTSFLNKFPKFIRKRKKYLLPFMPTAAETFDLRDFDIVISNSSSFAKGIITKPKTTHVCYCHAPTRFLWDWYYSYLNENKIKGLKKILLVPLLHYMRMWDKSASERVDYFITNSKNTANKIKKFYNRESEIIYPPASWFHSPNKHDCQTGMAVKRIKQNGSTAQSLPHTAMLGNYGASGKNYFLIVSRLSPYKKIDIAIEAFNKLGLPLIIIGDGQERYKLEKMAEKNIKFLGFQPEEELDEYYRNCYALIFPGEDDFGITIIEAMSFGKPVLALRKGGSIETIIENVTGEFFDDPIPEILADGIRRMKNNYSNYNYEKIIENAEKFSERKFKENIKNTIEKLK
ncbi:MAG: glycosyltransferase [Patescibacteria group bacterium]|nr:glycosyltransferase [Patescibacteria group bacterium]